MKVIYVIDSVTEINKKIDLLKNRIGNDIIFIVKASLVKLFQTYGYTVNAVYNNNLPKIIHTVLLKSEPCDVIYCKSSLNLNDKILNKFISTIGNKTKVVNVMPKYNAFENFGHWAYNIYVKSLFKTKDSLVSPKLQFLPEAFVTELLSSHFGNKLFEVNQNLCVNITFEDKELNKNLKEKTKLNKNLLIPVIVALTITIALLTTLVVAGKVNYLICLIFIFLYVLDIIFAIIYQCKLYFDKRFFDKD